jgi:LysM repeat protein
VTRRDVARLAAPAAFLLGATVFVLLVRGALDAEPATTTAPPLIETTTAPATTAVDTVEPPPLTATTEAASSYTIESGDTLESIADQFGTTVEELLILNPGIDPVNLTIGQRIRVP